MTDDFETQITELKNLVLSFEYEERELTSIPQDQIDYFGYACLSNSLMFKEPPIPQYDQAGITKYLQANNFKTLDSLISYISSLKNDIDKLIAIFAWEAQNVKYDVEALSTKEVKDTSLEAIFERKCAVDEGYCLFFSELVKKVNVDPNRIKITKYYSYSKTYGYDPLNIPESIEPDHCSLLIQINFIPFISEPSWAAGHLNSDSQFEWNFRPDLFLVPLVKTVCDRMPIKESLIPFHFDYNDFFKSCRVSPVGLCLKTESNPFVQYDSTDGYVSQIYSCKAPINWIQIHLHKRDPFNEDIYNEIPTDNITSYEIVQENIPNHPERCRFRTNISFQEEGFYKVEVYIDSPLAISYYVNNLSKCDMPVPITYNPFHDSKFIPIKPSRMLTKVRHGVALIRFAVSCHKSEIIWNIVKLKNDNSFDDEDGQTISRECGRFIKLKIPFDDTRYEDQLCITFPSNGRYSVQIYLSNDAGSYTGYTKYYIDVSGTELNDSNAVFSPIEFLCDGRDFSTASAQDDKNKEIKISPDQTCHIVDEHQLEQTIQIETVSDDQEILLEFREQKEITAMPELVKKEGNKHIYKWTIPDREAEYQLLCWINDVFSFSIPYIYRKKPLKDQTEEVLAVIDSLRQKVVLDSHYEKYAMKNVEDNNENDRKKSSKCCLLI